MKVRHVLIVITSVIIIGVIGFSFSLGRKMGISYGVEHAEEIKAKKRKKPQDEEINDNLKYVSAVAVENTIHPIVLFGYGKVNASSSVGISSEVQGVLHAPIELKKGTKFQKGQVLFSIKNTDVKMALESKKGNFLSLLTTILPDLKVDYPESFNKWIAFFDKIDLTQPLPPLPEFSSVKEKGFIVSRNVLSQYYSIKSEEERLKKYIVIAPFSGSIIEAFADDGATVAPGMVVIKVLREGKLEIEIPVLAQNLDLIKKGLKVRLKNNENDTILGKIIRVGEYVNPVTQTIPVFVGINNSEVPLYNGMYLESEILCNSVSKGVELPRTAIFGKDMVFVVDKNNQLHKKRVKIITRQDKTVLVEGLNDGELVVNEAIVNAKEGDKVALLNS